MSDTSVRIVAPSQISYLQSISTKVIQKIRYYYSTKDVTTTPNVHLQALLWNDHSVGSDITKQMPLKYTVEKTDLCWGITTNSWVCSDIMLQDSSNKRLPVTDFFIGEAKAGAAESEPVKIYFELLELCFYK
ncbi:jg26441 [Pararge aegeria aegeria]|uniref:Jg26441 protein n=1 Tax=Pararge aegeria aegeria TaxID=348720 RepID=A0A8S4QRL1_9NEOP|nr:jg26441 [Pararge aegeria aegeria]